MPQQEVALMAVAAYRQMLRNLKSSNGTSKASTEESTAALVQAKQRVMLRLEALKTRRAQRDPRRAFQRLYDHFSMLRAAKDAARRNLLSGLTAKRHTSSLRTAYTSLKQHGMRAMSSTANPNAGDTFKSESNMGVHDLLRGQQHGLDVDSVIGTDGIVRTVVLSLVASASKLFMNAFSTLLVENGKALDSALQRPAGQPLITVSNHVAAMDDPLLLAALTPLNRASQSGAMRWSLCATDRCFKNSFMSAFFRAGQVLPVERGRGMQQPGMKAAEAKLAAGEWVHIFPEGTRSTDGTRMGPIKAGIGHLIATCHELQPLVVPIIHDGMQHVMPRGRKLPVPGQTVRVVVGDPIRFADVLLLAKQNDWTESRLDRALAARVAESMTALKATLDGVQRSAATPQQDLPLVLLEDELDAAGHPWASPFLEQFVDSSSAGHGASALTSASRRSHCDNSPATALLPMDLIAQHQPQVQRQKCLQPIVDVQIGSSSAVRSIDNFMHRSRNEVGNCSHLCQAMMKILSQSRSAAIL